MLRPLRLLAPLLACAVLALASMATDARADAEAVKRWKTWKGDLAHLYDVIEKESSLKQIFKAKGIDWKAVRKEADKRFKAFAAEAKRRRKADQRTDEIAFYGVLRHVVSQLRDSHAYVSAGQEIDQAWWATRPPTIEAGIEFQPGTHGTILVSNVFPGRSTPSPLQGRGVRHEATVLESVNGTPATEYFEELARVKLEEEGWQSTHGRALSNAFNGLRIGEEEKLELVFKTLDASEKARRAYLDLPPRKREQALSRFKWKEKKVTLRAPECKGAQNQRNFRFMHLTRPEMQKTVDAGVWWCRLPSGYGYIAYYKVSQTARDGLTEACAALSDCPGLILDMRSNGGGGSGDVSAFDKRNGAWSKPLAVLIGPRSFSAAETDIWELQQMRTARSCNARFFGRTTAGASGDKINFELPSGFAKGRFVFRHWRGGRSKIEGAGLEPDEVVHQDIVELSLGIDSCIRAAELWFAEQM